jgi:hypothetical protein
MKTLKDIKKNKAVYCVSDERTNGDGLWVYLKREYWNPDMECRIIHEQTTSEVIRRLGGIIKL